MSNSSFVVAVSVNPEAKRHVRIAHQVNDSTAANVGVLVGVTVAILNKYNAKNRRDLHGVDSVRVAEDGEEHVVNVKWMDEVASV